jgi:hypothetical protein
MSELDRLDGALLYACIAQLETTQLQLLRLLRSEDLTIDDGQHARFNARLREIKDAAESMAGRVQLLLLTRGVDRRVLHERRRS